MGMNQNISKSGYADLPLHNGKVPRWLAERMSKLGGAITEALLIEYGKKEVIKRLSDPAWFQSLGCVLGMDWHSSGITTSVMGALKSAINPRSKEWGIYVCGGRGKHSRNTPDELKVIAEKTGLDGNALIKSSRLTAKVDNTAIQDGFQIYLHSFIISNEGDWSVVQQGMNGTSGYARRYHWHSKDLVDYFNDPHTFIYGRSQGAILNLADSEAKEARKGVMEIAKESPELMLKEIRKLRLPRHHDVKAENVDLKRLGTILALAQDLPVKDFESLLLLQGLGPRTLQSLTLVSEVIYGTPSRFRDPARFSFAHGGKDGHPFPVPTKVYDESISALKKAVQLSKIGHSDKMKAMKSLFQAAERMEKNFEPSGRLEDVINHEKKESWKYGGRTVNGWSKPPKHQQLALF